MAIFVKKNLVMSMFIFQVHQALDFDVSKTQNSQLCGSDFSDTRPILV
jgi:hypothetical protein